MVVREIYMSRTCAKVYIRKKKPCRNINTVYSMFEEHEEIIYVSGYMKVMT